MRCKTTLWRPVHSPLSQGSELKTRPKEGEAFFRKLGNYKGKPTLLRGWLVFVLKRVNNVE
jgi:hypothetical protein